MSNNPQPSFFADKTMDHLNLCLKTAQMGVWEATLLKDPLGTTEVKWDEEIHRMHGVPPGVSVDPMEWFYKHVHPDDLEPVRNSNRAYFKRTNFSGVLYFSYRILWPNGEVHHLELHGSIDASSATDTHVKMYGVAKDITQEVLRQKLLDDQKNLLLATSRMAVLGEISGGIAHEINNPLTVIQARAFQLLQLVENKNLDPAKIKSAAESISKTGDKIAKIVKSLRAFAHSNDNEPIDDINVYELIQETLDFCKIRFYNHGIDIRIGNIPETLDFECRLTQMEEALLSIFNNAHDAITNLDEKWILIEAFDLENEVEISVTDSGLGISDSVAENMMLPFFSTKKIGKGMGLGLCIAAEIITEHHGSIFLDRASLNTKFVLRLPKVQPKNV